MTDQKETVETGAAQDQPGPADQGQQLSALVNAYRDAAANAVRDKFAVVSTAEALKKKTIELQTAVNSAILGNAIVGKNEAERKAVERTMFSEQYQAVEELESSLAWAKYKVEAAQIVMDACKFELRVLELFG